MSLRILSVAYPLAPVSLDAAGGAEQILAILDERYVCLGHRSIVIACDGSRIRGELLSLPRAEPPFDEASCSRMHALCRQTVERAIADYAPDVLHFHGVDALAYLPPSGPPALVTMHLPPSFYPDGALEGIARPRTFVNCVSDSQRQSCRHFAHMVDVVPNGIRIEDYAPDHHGDGSGDFVLAMGRICPEKGYHDALDAAKHAGLELRLAGLVFPYEEHEHYFRREIVPRLTGASRFWGPVDLARKRELLARARCIVIPSLVPETSSLVAMEALASGTPVIARRFGALPEIIEHGLTGFLVDNVEEMAEAMSKVVELDRTRCRKVAERRFSAARMVARYIDRYEKMLAGGSLP